MKKVLLMGLSLLGLSILPLSAYATCDATGETPEGGEVVVCTGSETMGYDDTAFRDTVDVPAGATVGNIVGDTIEMTVGDDEVTINGGSVTSDADCIEGGDDADTIIINSGTMTCGSDGIRGQNGADRIEMHGGTITATDGDGLEGDDGEDVIIMTGGSVVVMGIDASHGIEADDGNDTVTVSGGSISVSNAAFAAIDGGDEDDLVEIAGDVALVGTIDGGDDSDTLRFSMAIPGAQVAAVNAALESADPASGSITINGMDYIWVNFEAIEAAVSASEPLVVPTSPFWSLAALAGLLGLIGWRRLGSRRPGRK